MRALPPYCHRRFWGGHPVGMVPSRSRGVGVGHASVTLGHTSVHHSCRVRLPRFTVRHRDCPVGDQRACHAEHARFAI